MVVIRLSPAGRIHAPVYRVMVCDKDAALTGRFIEKLGTYTPGAKGSLKLDRERYDYWLSKGAKASGSLQHVIKKLGSTPAASA